jgi:peptide/nickel transport system substrate-binding protein
MADIPLTTGQILSLPMDALIQQSLAEVGIRLDVQVVELENLYLHWRSGTKSEMNAAAINLGYVNSIT